MEKVKIRVGLEAERGILVQGGTVLARVARAGWAQTKNRRAPARVALARTKTWPGGRGQRWRRPPRARANYKSQQLPQRPSAGPSRSPGAPGGAAGPRGPPAGLAGGGVSCKSGAGRRRLASAGAARPGRGEGHRVSDPENRSGWTKGGGGLEEAPTLREGAGPCPGIPLCNPRKVRAVASRWRIRWGVGGPEELRPSEFIPPPPGPPPTPQ